MEKTTENTTYENIRNWIKTGYDEYLADIREKGIEEAIKQAYTILVFQELIEYIEEKLEYNENSENMIICNSVMQKHNPLDLVLSIEEYLEEYDDLKSIYGQMPYILKLINIEDVKYN